ncbi:ATP-binding protein [Pseudomonas sp. NPDC090203]|uniref:ATP-binding protein n=1 Tax=Pseudomonas sp. NPDC090203 TaxID=3364477 RepID=UPI00380163F9
MTAIHPLISKKARIITHEMIRVARVTFDRVTARRTGVIFYGESRVGKSRCARFVTDQLREQFPECYVEFHSVRPREGPQRLNLFKEICHSATILPKERVDYFYHLLGHIQTVLAGVECGQFVLVLDEIQYLEPADFHQLASLYNSLQLKDICLTLVGFAQPDILKTLSGLKVTVKPQLIARFFADLNAFHGCRNSDELATILRAYDSGSEFPPGSGTSYTAFFWPQAFAAGVRLVSLAELFWQEISDAVSGVYVKNIPMEHLCETVLNLLLAQAVKDSPSLQVCAADVSQAVKTVNLRTFCDAK